MIERLRTRLREWWARRIVWITAQRNVFGEGADQDWTPVVIVGREHYRESKKNYPIRGWRELSAALALEFPAEGVVLSFIDEWRDDRREVTIFELDPNFAAAQQQAVLWIPESLLVSRSLELSQLSDVDRFGLRYFCSKTGVSQLRGGLIRTPESYAMGVGVALIDEPLKLSESELRPLLLAQLLRLPATYWLRALQPGVWSRALQWLRPAAIACGASLLLYLTLFSAYLLGTTKWREYQLQRLGPEVGSLLIVQRNVDTASKEVELLAGALKSRPNSYRMWQLASAVWKTDGGALAGISFLDGEVTIRGSSALATDVLSSIGKLEGFQGAKFGAPVRQFGSREEFTIIVRVAPTVAVKAP